MDYIQIGTFLQQLRKEKGLTQNEIAEYFNINNKTVSKWECGNSLPELPLLKRLANFYGITVDEILNGCRNQQNKEIEVHEKVSDKRILDLWFLVSFITLYFGFILLFILGYTTNKANLACFISIGVYFVSISLLLLGRHLSSSTYRDTNIGLSQKIKDKKILYYCFYFINLLFFIYASLTFYIIPKMSTNVIAAIPLFSNYFEHLINGFIVALSFLCIIISSQKISDKLNDKIRLIFEICFIIVILVNIIGVAMATFIRCDVYTQGHIYCNIIFGLFDSGVISYVLFAALIISLIFQSILLIKKNKFITLNKVILMICFIGILIIYMYMDNNKISFINNHVSLITNKEIDKLNFYNTDRISMQLIAIIAFYFPSNFIFNIIDSNKNRNKSN